MEHFDTWIVAAALMLRQNRPCHYKKLAEDVIASRMTTLGLKGSTPEQTLGVILRQHPKIFKKVGRGIYTLSDPNQLRCRQDIKAVLDQFS